VVMVSGVVLLCVAYGVANRRDAKALVERVRSAKRRIGPNRRH
jgi:predicted protein tyrosine phosphatase